MTPDVKAMSPENHDHDIEVCRRLRGLLAAFAEEGIPRKEVARRIGISAEHLSRVAHGQVAFSQLVTEGLLREFGIQPHWLLSGTPPIAAKQTGPGEWQTTMPLFPEGGLHHAGPTPLPVEVVTIFRCPICKAVVTRPQTYCPECGRRLLWPQEKAPPPQGQD